MQSENRNTLLVLAAGRGTRFGGDKQLAGVGPDGTSLLEYSIYDAWQAGVRKIRIVTRSDHLNELQNLIVGRFPPELEIHLVCQDSFALAGAPNITGILGTCHAVLAAESEIDESFVVINADDYYGRDAINAIFNALQSPTRGSTCFYMVPYPLESTLSKGGPVSRGVCTMNDGKLVEVVEHTQLRRDDGVIRSKRGGTVFEPATPVSMNIWGFTPAFFDLARPVLLRHFDRAAESAITELQLPTVINTMLDAGAIEVLPVTGGTEWFGMTYRTDLDAVQAAIRDLTDAGVYPDPLWSRADA